MAGVHVEQAEREGVVPGDAVGADVEEPEAEVGIAVVGRGGRRAPGAVAEAVGEGERAVIQASDDEDRWIRD